MKKYLPSIFFIVGVLLAWQFITVLFSVPEYLLPSPVAILHKLIGIFPDLVIHIYYTSLESIFGFVVGSFLGIFLAILFVHSRTLELGLYPYAIALKTVPIVAIAPLLVVWIGNGILPKIIIAAIISFFPVVVNSTKGLRAIDQQALDLFESMSATKTQLFFKLRVPSSLPYLFSALKISSTLAVIGAIVGEFSGADRGLGFFIMISSHRLETTDMFVGVIISSLLGIVFFGIISIAERLFVPWSNKAEIFD